MRARGSHARAENQTYHSLLTFVVQGLAPPGTSRIRNALSGCSELPQAHLRSTFFRGFWRSAELERAHFRFPAGDHIHWSSLMKTGISFEPCERGCSRDHSG